MFRKYLAQFAQSAGNLREIGEMVERGQAATKFFPELRVGHFKLNAHPLELFCLLVTIQDTFMYDNPVSFLKSDCSPSYISFVCILTNLYMYVFIFFEPLVEMASQRDCNVSNTVSNSAYFLDCFCVPMTIQYTVLIGKLLNFENSNLLPSNTTQCP